MKAIFEMNILKSSMACPIAIFFLLMKMMLSLYCLLMTVYYYSRADEPWTVKLIRNKKDLYTHLIVVCFVISPSPLKCRSSLVATFLRPPDRKFSNNTS